MVVIFRGGAAGGLRRNCTGKVSRITALDKGFTETIVARKGLR